MGIEKPKKEKLGRNQFILMFFAFSFGMVLSNLLAQSSAQSIETSAAPLFVYKGIDKTLEDLSPDVKEKLVELYRQERFLIELAALEQHTHQYAVDNELDLKQASSKIFDLAELGDEQVNAFYVNNQETLGKPFYLVKEQIRAQLRSQQLKNAKVRVLNMLKENGDLLVLPGR